MTTVAQLTIEMAANVARLQRDMTQVSGSVDKAMTSVKRSAEIATKALGGLTSALSVGLIFKAADEYTKFTAQLRLATSSQEEFSRAYKDVTDIARSSQSDVAALGTLYARITNATRDLGLNQNAVRKITETVSLSLRVSGATATESASAMLQLSQAFGSGVLRGEEFNAINEAAPGLLRILADSIGIPAGKLSEMASNGELTSEVLAKAFTNQQTINGLQEQAKQLRTVSSGFVTLKNELVLAVGEIDKTTGATNALSNGLADTAKFLSDVTPKVVEFVKEMIPFAQGGAIVAGLAVLPNLITAVAVAVTTRLLPALIPLLPYVAAFSALAAGVGATIKILGANKNALQDLATSQERVLSLEKQIISAQNLIDTGQGSAVTTERLKTLKRNLDEAKKAVAEFQQQIKPPKTEGPISTVSALPAKTPALIKSGIGKPSKPLINKEEIQAKKEAEREYEELIRQIVKDVEDLEREGAAVFKATRTPIELMNIELARLDGLLTAGAIDWDTYSRAVDAATSEVKVSVESSVDIVDDLKDAINGFGREAGNAFVEFAKTGKTSVKDLVTSTLAEFAKMQAQKRVFDPLFKAGESLLSGIDFGSIFKFASGGIMSGAGSIPLKTYSNGGIANSPQLAVFGEGRMNEAYVPLPDGRTIPVTMTGGGGESNVVVNVINQPGQTATVKESQGNGGVRQIDVIIQQVEGAIASNISKGRGPVNSAITSQFGLNRAAGALR